MSTSLSRPAAAVPTLDEPPSSPPSSPISLGEPGPPERPSGNNQTGSATFEPLRTPMFRWFWLASLISNLGTWVHEVGAGWLMTSLDADPSMVSAVRVAISLPMLFLAIPAGGLIDRLQRRTVLIITTLMLLTATTTLTILTYNQTITSWSLLALTFAIGVSMVGHMLAWQSTVPEMVPREQLSRAVALGSISFNLARSVGPALGGVLIATIGTWSAFGFNAASFAGVFLLLAFWRPEIRRDFPKESFTRSIRAGLQYSLARVGIRSALIHLACFVLPASCLWALLPLYVRQDLGGDPRLYGTLVTLLGIGAVTAAMFLHRLQNYFGSNRLVATTMLVYGITMMVLGSQISRPIASVCLFVMGSAWMMTLTTFNSTVQLNLPSTFRGRGMSLYITVMSFSMAAGSTLWGQLASRYGVPQTFTIAGAVLLFTAALSLRFSLPVEDDD